MALESKLRRSISTPKDDRTFVTFVEAREVAFSDVLRKSATECGFCEDAMSSVPQRRRMGSVSSGRASVVKSRSGDGRPSNASRTGPPTREELLVHYPSKFTWTQLKIFVNSGSVL